MSNILNSEGRFSRIFERVFDLIMLNILWFICSVPVITIGASTSALYYVVIKIARGEDFAPLKSFVKAFQQNFIKATVIWIFLLIPGATLGLAYYYFYSNKMFAMGLPMIILLLCTLLYGMILLYVFPLQARFENAWGVTVINSFLLAVKHLPATILLAMCWIVPIVITFYSVINMGLFGFLWVLLGFSTIAWLTSYIYNRIFYKEMGIEPRVKREEDEEEEASEVEEEMQEDA